MPFRLLDEEEPEVSAPKAKFRLVEEEPKESFVKSALRTAYQPISGYLKKFTYPADLVQMVGVGEALDPEFIEHLKNIHEREGIPFSEEEYRNKVSEASEAPLTQSNIEKAIEKKTGLPLTAKTGLQKGLSLGGTAAGFTPGSFLQKGTAAIAAPSISKGAEALNVPEPISDLLGLIVGGFAGAKVPGELAIGAKTKPSGLPVRQFEKLEKPTKVSTRRYEKLNEKLENDFKNISDKILEKSPSFEEIKSDPIAYSNKLNEGFEKVEKLAGEIPETIDRTQLQSIMEKKLQTHLDEMKGITPSESEKTFRQEFVKLHNEIGKAKDEFSVANSVDQFRKNNRELAEYFEPGQSKAFNKGKRDALLEYNRSIENLYEDLFPESEFTKLFKEQNDKWSKLKDYEKIQDNLGEIFEGEKINFKNVEKILDKSNENFRRPFKRMLGEEGFKDFEALLKDFQSIKNPYNLIKKAESAGFGDLARIAGNYILHPVLSKVGLGKKALHEAFSTLLDKPQISIQWKRAVDDLKAGRFAEAEKEFEKLNKEVKKKKS